MGRLSKFALLRPRAGLAAWLACCALLALVGAGVDGHLRPTDLHVRGSQSALAEQLSQHSFGRNSTLPILLSGPSRDVRHQGRALAARLHRMHGVSVLSPWNAGARSKALRPASDQLVLLASLTGPEKQMGDLAVAVRKLAKGSVQAPVSARVTGVPLVSRDLSKATMRAVHRADLIALPVLLLVLLIVFGSPLAAAIPVAFAAMTVLAGNGVLDLVARVVHIDAFATALASMMGLALAVDYSLLMVARYREEREHLEHRDAVRSAAASTGHIVLAAGAAIALAMGLAAALSPARPVLSATIGVAAVAVLSIAGATLAVPAMLMLAGRRIAVARVRSANRSPLRAVGVLAMRRPVPALVIPALLLGALSIPALSLHTGAPGVRELPAGNAARQDFEAMNKVLSPGWGGGFEIIAAAHRGTMTTPVRLRALARLQRAIGADPQVVAVFGPGSIERSARALRRAGHQLLDEQAALRRGVPAQLRGLSKLDSSVTSANNGVSSLHSALGEAATSAAALSAGSSAAAGGVQRLQAGVHDLGAGAERLRGTLRGADSGQRKLAAGARAARTGADLVAAQLDNLAGQVAAVPAATKALAQQIRDQGAGVGQAAATLRQQHASVDQSLKAAQLALLSAKQTTATIAAARAVAAARAALAAGDVPGTLDSASGQLGKTADSAQAAGDSVNVADAQRLAHEAGSLATGLGRLDSKVGELGNVVSSLGGGASAMIATLQRVSGGTQALGGGLARLRAGAKGLAGGVQQGATRTAALAAGLHGARSAVSGIRGDARPAPAPGKDSPDPRVLNSGYFVLAALDGRGTDSGLNVNGGGQAARILVVPRGEPDTPQTRALYGRIQKAAKAFGLAAGATVAVGGPAAQLTDYQGAVSHNLPRIVILLALATALLLGIMLRSVAVALIGVALNLLSVGATIGILALLFTGSHPLLGGTGRLDATTVTVIFAVMFALSIDYQVFIVTRIREEFMRGRGAAEAIAAGMHRTTGVVTGAALSTVTVFASFAITDVSSLRAFGAGLAISVVLDVTVVRMVLLPAALRLAGAHAWWPGKGSSPEPALPNSQDMNRRPQAASVDVLGGLPSPA